MDQVIGECSQCGGNVAGYVGPWMGVVPPPPPSCQSCGAVSAQHHPVIPTRPRRGVVKPVPSRLRPPYGA
jgi:hypothetical protein